VLGRIDFDRGRLSGVPERLANHRRWRTASEGGLYKREKRRANAVDLADMGRSSAAPLLGKAALRKSASWVGGIDVGGWGTYTRRQLERLDDTEER
jgi:hypothetical protein